MTIEHEVEWETISPHTSITYETVKETPSWLDYLRGKRETERVVSFTISYKDPDDSRWDKEVTVDWSCMSAHTVKQAEANLVIYHHRLLSAIPSRLAKNIIKSMDETGRWVETWYSISDSRARYAETLQQEDTKTGMFWMARFAYDTRGRDVYSLESHIGLSAYDKTIIAKAMVDLHHKRKEEKLAQETLASHQHLQSLYGDH